MRHGFTRIKDFLPVVYKYTTLEYFICLDWISVVYVYLVLKNIKSELKCVIKGDENI